MKAVLIEVDGTVVEIELPDTDKWPLFSKAASELVQGPLELVAVIYDDQPCTMLVSEIGASLDPEINPAGQMPCNARATAIYWTATILGITSVPFQPLQDPLIHGRAILIQRYKKKL